MEKNCSRRVLQPYIRFTGCARNKSPYWSQRKNRVTHYACLDKLCSQVYKKQAKQKIDKMPEAYGVSIHPSLKNKPPVFQPEFSDNWQHKQLTLVQLQDHISSGGAFIAATMSSARRSSAAFQVSQLVVVDVDHGLSILDFSAHALAKQCAWVYTTANHTEAANRYRCIFQLKESVSNADHYKAIASLLIKAIGGDKACSDACRIYYGNDQATHPLWQPGSYLDSAILKDAQIEAAKQDLTFNPRSTDFEPDDIERAIFCLEEVIEPTADGEREDKFLPITMACSKVGAALFPAWQDWAQRGYHGKKGRQSSQKYFEGSVSSKHTLGTIFYLAGQDDPNWRERLPEELRSGHKRYSIWERFGVAGYEPEDFIQDDDDDLHAALERAVDEATELIEPAHITALLNEPDDDGPKPWHDQEPEDDEPDPNDLKKKDTKELTENTAIAAVKTQYPQLRYNTTAGTYEYGSIHKPSVLAQDQMEHAYMKVNPEAGVSIPKAMIKDAIVMIAEENKYSPVVRYLNSCAANAKPIDYLHRIGSELLGLPEEGANNPRLESGQLLHDAIMQRFFIGAVARALNPGCTHDWMPILVGSQACGKTSFLQYITPPNPENQTYEWSCLIQQDINTLANRPHKLHAGWVVVLDECERYFHRRHVEQLKNLVSTPVDRSALKYRNEMTFPRTFVLAGACNNTDFLSDPTGNRRFMPVIVEGKIKSKRGVKTIDLDRVKQDRDAIWAAAYKAYLDNPVHLFDSSELMEVQDYVSSFEQENPLDKKVITLTTSRVSGTRTVKSTGREERYWRTADLLEWLEVPTAQQNSMVQLVTDSFKRLGFKRVQYRCDGSNSKPSSIWIKRNTTDFVG